MGGLAFDSNDNLFVAAAGGASIEKISGGVFSVFGTTTYSGLNGLAFDSAGNLYVAIQYGYIMRLAPSGGVASVFATGPSGAQDIAILVPEPSGLVLLGLGLSSLLLWRLRPKSLVAG
jgi:streptogramin lyase